MADAQPSGPAQHDGGQFESRMGGDKGIEVATEAQDGDVAGDRSGERAVVRQEQQAADTEQDAGDETLKGYPDVVHDVEAEHHPIIAGISNTADHMGGWAVHLLKGTGRSAID